MPTVDLIDLKGKKSGSVDLPGSIFDVQTNVPLIHQVVVAQLAAARQGTQSTLRRGEVLVLAASRSSKREPVARVRVRFVCLSTAVVELFTVQSLVTTHSALLKR